MGKPGVILTSQFTTPTAKSFTDYLKYMTRKEALADQKNLTPNEKKEQLMLESSLRNHEMNLSNSDLEQNEDKLSNKEVEALRILKTPSELKGSNSSYNKYIEYMGRHYALDTKDKRTDLEEKEISVVRKKISTMVGIKNNETKEHPVDDYKQGVFSIEKQKMNSTDLQQVRNIVQDAQNNGSVFYQDVISFDTDFLVKEGILNKKKNELDEHRLQQASRKMMKQMFEDEKMDTGYWFASIHRNTDHIHIHFGTVEKQNTRKVIEVEEDGYKYLAPKGKRKQQTIDNMKSTFSNSLIDRTAQLTRISDLRNTLVEEMKESGVKKNTRSELKLIKEIYSELPTNQKYWQYGSKQVSSSTRDKIDVLTKTIMKDNKHYTEYVSATKKESDYRKELFGDTQRTNKDYFKNKQEDINKRLGNALLKTMKETSLKSDKSRKVFYNHKNKETNDNNTGFNKSPSVQVKKSPVSNRFLSTERNLRKFKQALDNDIELYKAEREHEQVQQRIDFEKQLSR